MGLRELDYSELFPEVANARREALTRLENARLEKEAALTHVNAQIESALTLLLAMPNQPSVQAKLVTLEAEKDGLVKEVETLRSQIDEAEASGRDAEQIFQDTQSGLQRLDQAHGKRGQDLYDVRSRLHQLLRRAIDVIEFYPRDHMALKPEFEAEWHGGIAIRFKSAKTSRQFSIEKGMAVLHSFPVRNGNPDWKKVESYDLATH